MRELERIDRITEMIRKIWIVNQDQRFGQLLINLGLMPDEGDIWNIEDSDIDELLKLRIKLDKKKIGGKNGK